MRKKRAPDNNTEESRWHMFKQKMFSYFSQVCEAPEGAGKTGETAHMLARAVAAHPPRRLLLVENSQVDQEPFRSLRELLAKEGLFFINVGGCAFGCFSPNRASGE